jgi:mRNA-degrading endonuclease toxin of MazEF toxin-antitoxin module
MCRGEIWLLNLDPTVGAEIRKTRPVIISTQLRTPWQRF